MWPMSTKLSVTNLSHQSISNEIIQTFHILHHYLKKMLTFDVLFFSQNERKTHIRSFFSFYYHYLLVAELPPLAHSDLNLRIM